MSILHLMTAVCDNLTSFGVSREHLQRVWLMETLYRCPRNTTIPCVSGAASGCRKESVGLRMALSEAIAERRSVRMCYVHLDQLPDGFPATPTPGSSVVGVGNVFLTRMRPRACRSRVQGSVVTTVDRPMAGLFSLLLRFLFWRLTGSPQHAAPMSFRCADVFCTLSSVDGRLPFHSEAFLCVIVYRTTSADAATNHVDTYVETQMHP